MLVVADINTPWRSRPFEALGRHRSVLGLAPRDWLLALRSKRRSAKMNSAAHAAMQSLAVTMPLHWAKATKSGPQLPLWRAATSHAASRNERIRGLVVTSPHYLPLCREIGSVPVFYYCSDDYRNYKNWNPGRMTNCERELARLSKHSFFVSEELRKRAVKEYGLAEESTSVCMNATDDSFLEPVSNSVLSAWREEHGITRPTVGVVGGINHRLSFELLREVSQMPEIGCLLMVGPADHNNSSDLMRLLRTSPKIRWVGEQPHDQLHIWHHLLDVALIPYKECEFNRYCSPMRLFDHMAAGCPIVATTACRQASEFEPHVRVADGVAFLQEIRNAISETKAVNAPRNLTWMSRGAQLAAKLAEVLPD